MNTSDENTQPTKIDEYSDRLIDRGLAELIGGDTPPNLSGRICSAATASMPTAAARTKLGRSTGSRWLAAAVAASLLLGGAFLLSPTVQYSRQAARISEASKSLSDLRGDFSTPAAPQDGAAVPSSNQVPTSGPSPQLSAGNTLAEYSRNKLAKEKSTLNAPNGSMSAIGLNAFIDEAQDSVEVRFATPNQSTTWGFTADPAAQFGGVVQEGRGGRGIEQKLYARDGREMSVAGGYGRGGYGSEGYGSEGMEYSAALVKETAEGIGPHLSGDQYTRIVENPFIKAEGANAVSTFSIDVDTASYANVRQFLMGMNTLPPPDAVRIEELINYFDYDYAGPPADATDDPDTQSSGDDQPATGGDGIAAAPFAAHVEVAGCPWKAEHRLVRIGIKGREMDRNKRPRSNLVFLVDVSGSMNEPNKLPLVVYGLEQLTRELGENDRVAIVVYASSEGLVLPSTSGSEQQVILAALGQLQAGGSTAGGAGIQLAYQIAEDNFLKGGTNRVVLCTDGDFNVGVTSTAELERLCEQKAKDTGVFLSVLGFGRGNLNDAMMEAIADQGNGNYHYVDNRTEARRVLVEEMTGTLVTIAKDVKIQVEFNPRQVAGYRLIGYENRMLRTEDFNDDTKDAGEIGAGHTVTALYEIVPAGQNVDVPPVDKLKYQPTAVSTAATGDSKPDGNESGNTATELLTLKMRYKQPDGDTSRKLDWAVSDNGKTFRAASGDFQFAAAVAGFGLLLRDSQHKGNLTFAAVLELAQSGIGKDEHGYRAEFLEIVRRAQALRGE
jgi:Ca-activated chloride channel family protein